MQAKNIVSKDEKGGVSTVTIPNVFQSKGSPVSAEMGLTRWFGGGIPGGSALVLPHRTPIANVPTKSCSVYAGALRIADKPGADRIVNIARSALLVWLDLLTKGLRRSNPATSAWRIRLWAAMRMGVSGSASFQSVRKS